MPSITIYTRTTCAPCRAVKMWLQNKGFHYQEKNVDDDPALMNDIISKSGFAMVPMIEVGDKIISGQNFALLSKTLML